MIVHKQLKKDGYVEEMSDMGRAGTFGAFLQSTLEQKYGQLFHSMRARGIAIEAGFGDEQTWRNWMDSKTLPRAGQARQKLADFLGMPLELLEMIIDDSVPRHDEVCPAELGQAS